MGRVVIFVLLFIGFLIIKMVLIGGRKVVEVGAEAFDSVNGTNYSTKLNFYLTPPTLDESIVGLLSIASYESKEIGLVERSIINHTIEEFSRLYKDSRLSKNRLLKVVDEIGNLYEEFLFSENSCFFKENSNLIKRFLYAVNRDGNRELKEKFLKQFIALITINSDNRVCKRKFILLVGKKLGFEEQKIEEMIREINPKFGLGNKDRQKSPYEILGVLPTDSFESIKKRYKELMIKFHPDNLYSKNLDKEFMEFATAKVKEINWAYEKIKEERGVV